MSHFTTIIKCYYKRYYFYVKPFKVHEINLLILYLQKRFSICTVELALNHTQFEQPLAIYNEFSLLGLIFHFYFYGYPI